MAVIASDPTNRFGEYIVYVDESGDHTVTRVYPTYPVFVLAFCVFHAVTYASTVCPEIQRLKFAYFGHDLVVLHERDVAHHTGPFAFLANATKRMGFIRDLTDLMIGASFSVIAVVIRKPLRVDRTAYPVPGPLPHLYHLALRYGLSLIARSWKSEVRPDRSRTSCSSVVAPRRIANWSSSLRESRIAPLVRGTNYRSRLPCPPRRRMYVGYKSLISLLDPLVGM